MWEMNETERLVRRVMIGAAVTALVLLALMGTRLHPQRLSGAFAPAQAQPTLRYP